MSPLTPWVHPTEMRIIAARFVAECAAAQSIAAYALALHREVQPLKSRALAYKAMQISDFNALLEEFEAAEVSTEQRLEELSKAMAHAVRLATIKDLALPANVRAICQRISPQINDESALVSEDQLIYRRFIKQGVTGTLDHITRGIAAACNRASQHCETVECAIKELNNLLVQFEAARRDAAPCVE